MTTELPQWSQPYSLFWSLHTTQVAIGAEVLLAAFAAEQCYYYSSHWDVVLQANAGLWANMFNMILSREYAWASLIGNTDGQPNDGIVLGSSASYPGGTTQVLSYAAFGSIGHLTQHVHPAVTLRVRTLLRDQFLVPAWPVPPPTPPHPIAVSGPSAMRPGQTCLYVASSATGTPPYVFEWYADATFVGVGESMMLSVGTTPAQFSVIAYDQAGLLGSGGLMVASDAGAAGCYAQ